MATEDAMDVESNIQNNNNTNSTTSTPIPFMDVDSSSSATARHLHQQPQPHLHQPDIESAITDARLAVVAFLTSRHSEQIVPANSRVVLLDCNILVRNAFRALIENGM